MKLALYKGPAQDWVHRIGHWAVCIFTGSRYSHVELVIGDRCFSASARDGGVRCKTIDLASGHWDLVDCGGDEAAARAWFDAHEFENYDWAGVLRFAVPFLPQRANQWFCSEAVAAMVGLPQPQNWTPRRIGAYFREPRVWCTRWLPLEGFAPLPGLILLHERNRGDTALIAHERVHCLQQRRLGWWRFWWLYLSHTGYRQATEVDAYRAQIEVAVAAGRPRDAVLQRCASNLASLYRLPLTLQQAKELLA